MKSAYVAGLLSAALAAGANAAMFNGHDYQVVLSEGVTWESARSAAQGLGTGWDLATIGSAAENAFLESLLGTSYAERSHFWLGATDSVAEGTWAWVDGTPWSFTDWASGEPNNAGNEDFLAFDLRNSVWAWNDAPTNVGATFGFARGFIAESNNVGAVPIPGALPLFLSGLAGIAVVGHRRKKLAT